MRPTDADGFRRAWDVVARRWDAAVQRARALPEDVLHERVDGEWADTPAVPREPDARPSLKEVLALRADRMATVRRVLDELTDDRLGQMTQPVLEPGYPESKPFLVLRCLSAVVNEEWLHREYAERDLAILERRPHSGSC